MSERLNLNYHRRPWWRRTLALICWRLRFWHPAHRLYGWCCELGPDQDEWYD